jgi:hypothetical protein
MKDESKPAFCGANSVGWVSQSLDPPVPQKTGSCFLWVLVGLVGSPPRPTLREKGFGLDSSFIPPPSSF